MRWRALPSRGGGARAADRGSRGEGDGGGSKR